MKVHKKTDDQQPDDPVENDVEEEDVGGSGDATQPAGTTTKVATDKKKSSKGALEADQVGVLQI